ncbi:hypothetical protein Zm00014a_017119 [Zea mays]|uniref:Uncharacterized protein n=1 Tax=Zea mays TaxID=4577 RepID=A0A3L6DIX8_MAIZE|nr:hypothetical protein Zm00014a_017119 [Zea mays]
MHFSYEQVPGSPLRPPGEAPEHHWQPCQPAVAHPRRPPRSGGARRVLEDRHAAARRRAVRSAEQGPGKPAQPPDATWRAAPRVGRRLQPAGEGRQPPVAGAGRADLRARRCARGRVGEPRPPGAPGAAGRPAAVERVQRPEPPPAAEPEADGRHGCAGGAQLRGGRPVHPAEPDQAIDVEYRGGAEVRGHAGRAAEPGRADDDVRLIRRRSAGVRGDWVPEPAEAKARSTGAGGVDGGPGVHAGARHADAVPVRQDADAPGGARRDEGAGGGGAVQHARHREQDQGGRRPGLPQSQARTRHPDYILIIPIW